MTKRVRMPDGVVVGFPDNVPDDFIRNLVREKFPDAIPPDTKIPEADATGARHKAIPEQGADRARNVPVPVAPKKPTTAREAFRGGVGHGAFGLGDYASAAGARMGGLTNPEAPQSFDQALTEERALREQEYEEHPIASTAGNVVGSVMSGNALARGAAALPGIGQQVALRAGQPVRNVLRLAGFGGAGGAAQAAGTGEDVAEGATTGAVLGPLAAGATRLAVTAKRAVAGLASRRSASENAISALAKRINATPSALQNAMDTFRTATGRPPTLVEIVDAGSAENLASIARMRSGAGEVFDAAAQRVTAARPTTMARQIRRGGIATNLSTETSVQNQNFNRAMQPIAGNLVDLPRNAAGDIDLPPRLIRAIADDVRANADPAAATAYANGQVSIRTIDNVRQALNQRNLREPGHSYAPLSRRITGIGATAHPEYQAALDEFGVHARSIKGFRAGQKAMDPAEAGDINTVRDLATPEAAIGREAGVRMRLSNEARASEEGAVRTAEALRQRGGEVQREAKSALWPGKAEALQELGEAEVQSAARLRQVTPKLPAPSDELSKDIQAAAEAAVAAGGRTLTGFVLHAARRIVERTRVSPATARRIAEAATDARNLPDVIAALRRARLRDDEIRRILGGIAVAGGTAGSQGSVE